MTNKKGLVVKQFGTDGDYCTIFSSDTQWERYLKYLMLWTLEHQEEYYEGMSPACYNEFCDNDDEPEYYEEQLDYAKIERDCKETIRHWKGE